MQSWTSKGWNDLSEMTSHRAAKVASGDEDDIVLRVDDLSKSFVTRRNPLGMPTRRLQAVDGVSFDLRRGETLALVGASGSGKSTTARLVARLEKPDRGRIVVRGVDWSHMRQMSLQKHRRSLQMVFQNPFASLDPTKMVVHLVGEPLIIYEKLSGRLLDERVRDLLDDVGLSANAMNKYPHEFSGGQRQRLAIARALAADPEIVIADEAVSALDVSTQAKVLNLLADIQRDRAVAILFITHDLGVVRQIADRVAVMSAGRIVEQGPAEDIFTSPQDDYTRGLLDAVPVMGRWT